MKKYLGITIGPIFETINTVSSPASLWFISSFFSDVTRRICDKLNEQDDVTILSPFPPKDMVYNGIGKYHDRIFACAEDFSNIDKIIADVKAEAAANFGETFCTNEEKQFLANYLQINYVITDTLTDKNIILSLSHLLDSMELINNFPNNNDNNPFTRLSMGIDGDNGNEYVKSSLLYKKIGISPNDQLTRKQNIRTIDEIASNNDKNNSELKYSDYYAVVSADGDYVGKLLKTLSTDEQLQKFSAACISYATQASELIGKFGGMTIYAGGDDLLFLAPIIGNDKRSVFSLCKEINKLFVEATSTLLSTDLTPCISFGIFMAYKKAPLYEAIKRARNLLYVAKNESSPIQRNNIAYTLQKHSGQSVSGQLLNSNIDVFDQLIATNQGSLDLKSVMHHLIFYKKLLKIAENNLPNTVPEDEAEKAKKMEGYIQIWDNIFDNEGQKQYSKYIAELAGIYYEKFLYAKQAWISYYDNDTQKYSIDNLNCFLNCLKIKKFLTERRGEK